MGQRVVHTLEPVMDGASRVLLLGTMPSPKSRQAGFYYAHPQNRFWRVMEALFGEAIPSDREGRRSFLLRRRIALWDVLASCVIEGADDGSIREPVPNDMARILRTAEIRAVFTTGSAAARLYARYCLPVTGREAIALPSTSPANCRMSLEALVEAYRPICRYL